MVNILSTIEEYNEAIGQSDVLVVVDFHATWCGPCVAVAPAYAELPTEHPTGKALRAKLLNLVN